MNRAEVIHMPIHTAHAEFYEWYDFGDHLHVGESLEDQHKKTLKKLRNQYLNETQNAEQSKFIYSSKELEHSNISLPSLSI